MKSIDSIGNGENTTANTEAVKNAAILYKGKIFEGATHENALGILLKDIKEKDLDFYKRIDGDEYKLISELEKLSPNNIDFEGFVTTNGRYVNRSEATEIARLNLQLNKHKDQDVDLHSEDLRR